MANEKRLIDANEFWNRLRQVVYDIAENDDFGHLQLGYSPEIIEEVLKQTKIVDAVEVVHGRWFMRGGIFRCSECDSKALLKLDSNVGGCREYTHFRSNYCPNCGAKMDGDVSG